MNVIIESQDVSFWYGNGFKALKNITANFKKNEVSALIGPSGCGKSTFLRCINRLNEELTGSKIEGNLTLGSQNIYDKDVDPVLVRQKVGMVFQQPNPFPAMSVYENVIAGVKLNKLAPRNQWDEIVETSLKKAALWEEVKDSLNEVGASLSGGQQQRLCIARAIAPKPEVILMDEPTSALDPIATERIENLMSELKEEFSVIIVTHNMQQAKRISNNTCFFVLGELLEQNETNEFYTSPKHPEAQRYLQGEFG